MTYKAVGDYAPNHVGRHTEPSTNSVEYHFEELAVAKEAILRYVLQSSRHNSVRWVETSDGTWQLVSEPSNEPLQSVHAKIEQIAPRTDVPSMMTADDRIAQRREMNAANSE